MKQQESHVVDLKKTVDNIQNGLDKMKQQESHVIDLEKTVDTIWNGLDTMKEDVAESNEKLQELENRIQQMNVTVVNCCQKAGEYCSIFYLYSSPV